MLWGCKSLLFWPYMCHISFMPFITQHMFAIPCIASRCIWRNVHAMWSSVFDTICSIHACNILKLPCSQSLLLICLIKCENIKEKMECHTIKDMHNPNLDKNHSKLHKWLFFSSNFRGLLPLLMPPFRCLSLKPLAPSSLYFHRHLCFNSLPLGPMV